MGQRGATGRRSTNAPEWKFNYRTLPVSSHCLAPGTALACFLLGNPQTQLEFCPHFRVLKAEGTLQLNTGLHLCPPLPISVCPLFASLVGDRPSEGV